LDNYGENYLSYDFMLVSSGWDASAGNTVTDIKGWFQSNAIDYAHHLHGNLSSVWTSLGYAGGIPYNVLIDRDKNVRMAENYANGSAWQTCIEEMIGY
jgi:hypothetical protein